MGDFMSTFWSKDSTLKNVLYYIVIAALVVALVMMRGSWTKHRQEYQRQMREATSQEQVTEIQPRTAEDLQMD